MISVRIENQYYNGDEFRDIPVKIGANGGKVLLQDIATIKDTLWGRPILVFWWQCHLPFCKSDERPKYGDGCESVKSYIEQKNAQLPSDLKIKTLVDMTYYLNARLDMMLKNLLWCCVGGINA